jgi:thioredoxin 2
MHLVCPACGTINRVADARLQDGPVCGRCASELLPLAPVSLDDDSLPRYLAHSEQPVLVDFWAIWCAPCLAMAPNFAAVAKQTPGVRFVKVDSDAARLASARHSIRSIPTLVLFKAGRELARLNGAVPAAQLAAWLQQQLDAAAA